MGAFVPQAVGQSGCSVCGLVRADWIDREAGVMLCEHVLREGGEGEWTGGRVIGK